MQGEREFTSEVLDKTLSVFFVEVDDDLGV